MITVAIETSASRGGVALFRDRALLDEVTWDENNVRNQHAVAALEQIMACARISYEEVSLYVVGRGPGRYSGLRGALALAAGLALPGGTEIYAVPSGDALAADAAAGTEAEHIAILGDARRKTLWLGLYRNEGGKARSIADWALHSWETLQDALPANTLVLSPDWNRLSEHVPDALRHHARWPTEVSSPSAAALGRAGLDRRSAGVPSDPLLPIYMHPAV